MRAGFASVALLGVSIILVAAKGAANWSHGLALVCLATFGAAGVVALVALIQGLAQRRAPLERRVAAVGLALPALIGVGVFVWFVVFFIPDFGD